MSPFVSVDFANLETLAAQHVSNLIDLEANALLAVAFERSD